MKEYVVEPGERIDRACQHLIEMAPAFMLFNDIRVEAAAGDTVDTLYARWSKTMDEHRAAHEAAERETLARLQRLHDDRIRQAERARIASWLSGLWLGKRSVE